MSELEFVSTETGVSPDHQRRLEPLMNPRSVAFIGASADEKRIGGIALSHMVNYQYAGGIYPINPKYQEVFGLPCYADIESVPETPDLVVVSVSAEQVLPMLKRCQRKGVAAAILYATGFAEEGASGKRLQDELSEFSNSTGMLVCGPNCMGLANLNTRAITAFATMFSDYPPTSDIGNIGLVTQSGNMCAVLYMAGCERGLRFNYFINTGNEACIEYGEYLDFLARDADTTMVVGYVEGLRDGSRFISVAGQFREQQKPVIILKAGSTEKASEVVLSHTAALAGDHAVNKAAFRQLGIMQAREPGEVTDLAYIASFKKRPTNNGVIIASVSGAMGAVLADLIVSAGASVPTLSTETQQNIKDLATGVGIVTNPIDMTAQIFNREGVARGVFASISEASEGSTVLVYATGYMLDRIATELVEAASSSNKFFVVIDTGKAKRRRDLESAGIPVFTDVARAADALGGYLQWCSDFERGAYWAALRDARGAPPTEGELALSRLDEYGVKRLLNEHGVQLPREKIAHHPDEAAQYAEEIGFPVALKILSPDILHKSDIGGVRLNLGSAEEVKVAYDTMIEAAFRAHPEAELRGVLVSAMETGVCELIVGFATDPVFGKYITVGLGGVFTELFRDSVHRLLPVDKKIAKDMLEELRSYPILSGFRGMATADIDGACEAIEALSNLAYRLGDDIIALEINPLLVRERGKGAVALDALIVAQEAAQNTH